MTWSERNGRPASPRGLYRDPRRAWLAGVCAGIADYFGVTPCMVRALTVASAIFSPPPTVIGYLIAAFVLKRRPDDMYGSAREEAFWRSVRLEPGRTAHDLSRKFQELERRLRAAEARVTSSEFKLRRQFRDLEG
jgi:phage shock protein C